ncbi:hypothetical protein [Acidithiobacillus sulfurivorans]|uniref:Tetratricopeptide repeat protein n=1 Tax=Acidithiobacillus sulfurivorans TaxID=1958756 RepID=A0ABS5ZUP7_9PROT|nr:hypothetical protein [Acidithiobacillus sulfurivorans]MBU2758656.1 hypothetical protein [Acidithiobacillus sulfurivorans]
MPCWQAVIKSKKEQLMLRIVVSARVYRPKITGPLALEGIMRTLYSVFHFPLRFASIFFWFIAAFLLPSIPVAAMAADAITPQIIQSYIAHADPAKALKDLVPILKADPHSAKAWYLEAEAWDALGHDYRAKVALRTAEHLSPAMSFANPKDLKGLEKRVGLQNVQSSREHAYWMKVFLGILLVVLLIGTGAFWFVRNESRKAAALVESDRQDILLEITQFLTGELNSARISADAQGDNAKLNDIYGWQTSLVDCSRTLKRIENADTDSKKSAIEDARNLLESVRNQLSGKPSSTEPEITPFDASGTVQNSPFPPSSSYVSAEPSQPAVYPVNNMGGNMGMNTGGGFGAALEEGLGMGLGMEIAEDLLGGGMDSFGNNGGDSFGSGDFGSSGMDGDGFGGGTDDGLGLGGGDNFGGTDDGFSGGDSFGGGADDGFSSDDSSW